MSGDHGAHCNAELRHAGRFASAGAFLIGRFGASSSLLVLLSLALLNVLLVALLFVLVRRRISAMRALVVAAI